MREKLIELIDEKQVYGIDQEQPRKHDIMLLDNDELADHLIANGVTFATDTNVGGKWIPVSERLPNDDIPSSAYLCWWCGHTHICKWWRTRKCFEFNGRVVKVTHWMPLPEPPKEGE